VEVDALFTGVTLSEVTPYNSSPTHPIGIEIGLIAQAKCKNPKANEQTFLMPFEWMENANLKQVVMTLSHDTICV
jgi:hypothetical protein